MVIPLKNLLKGRLLRIAELQDRVILFLVRHCDIIFHGGTAIWRVYGGKRFSFDLDIYCSSPEKISVLLEDEFNVIKKRITSGNVLYMKIEENRTVTEIEASPEFRKTKTHESEFYLVDGSSVLVKVLTPEELIKEKILAFKEREKARDLYDIYHLLPLCDVQKVEPVIRGFKPKRPKDWNGLKEIILLGATPSYESVILRIEKYAKS